MCHHRVALELPVTASWQAARAHPASRRLPRGLHRRDSCLAAYLVPDHVSCNASCDRDGALVLEAFTVAPRPFVLACAHRTGRW
jgi:hypothetical protein